MKTLDETINNIETCQKYSICISCPYCGFNECKSKWGRDALYYLREYKEKKQKIVDISADYVALKQWWAEQQENPPLTLEELKAMRGKPVWIEYMEKDYENEWVLVVKNPERPIFGTPTLLAFARDGERIYLTISGYGKRWQAYRNMK